MIEIDQNPLLRHRTNQMRAAHSQFRKFAQAQIEARKKDIHADQNEGRDDVFTMLVKSNEDDGGKLKLTDDELVSDQVCLYLLVLTASIRFADRKRVYHAYCWPWYVLLPVCLFWYGLMLGVFRNYCTHVISRIRLPRDI